MKWSLNLGKIAGTRLLVHWTFLILIGWIVFSELRKGSDWPAVLLNVAFVLTLFACVVLHEFGHALAARRYGITTRTITLLPIGGVARLERIPEDPKQELVVAVAGPAVNVLIALVLALVVPVGQKFRELYAQAEAQQAGQEVASALSAENFLFSLFTVNLMLVAFNAIPAFPMDGGRVLRALLAMKLGRVRATRIAANLGQLLAIGFVLLGLLYNPFLIFIGIFVYFGAQTENVVVQQLEFLRGHPVREAMMTHYATLSPADTLQTAIERLLDGSEQEFIVVEEGQVRGILTRAGLLAALKVKGRTGLVADNTETRVPAFRPDDDLAQVYLVSQQVKAGFFPVVEQGRLVGAISLENIQEYLMVQSALSY